MYKQIRQSILFLLAVLAVLVCMPSRAQAAQEPAFKKAYKYFYENRTSKGVYEVKVQNIKKGYILKWSISGTGKDYASFDASRTVAEKKTAVNKLTVNSHGEADFAAVKKIDVTVKVYTEKNKLLKELKFTAKLRNEATEVSILTSEIENLNQITAGRSYEFGAEMLPANTTSLLYWQVTDASGADCSAEITPEGVWTPSGEGTYTITASARNAPKDPVLCSKSVQAVAGSFIESVTQTAANGIQVTFNTEASGRYKDSDFAIKSGGASMLIKKIKFLEDGKTVYITTASDFSDRRSYVVSCAGSEKEFTASVGKPVALSITTSSAQVEKFTTIRYVLLDANNIDVTAIEAPNGTMAYSGNVNNGYLDQQSKRLYMTTIGNIATVTLDYTSKDGTIHLTDTKTVICVPQKAEEPVETRFTLTNSEKEPSFKEEDLRSIAVGNKMYAHFQGLDEDDSPISYDSVTYESANPDHLIISQNGKITPIKTGTVSIVVTVRQGTDSLTFTYPVTITAARYMAQLQMKETAIEMSNTYMSGYQKEIPVKAVDQYGKSYELVNEIASVSGGSQRVLASYDPVNHNVIIRAQGAAGGVYDFVLTVTMNGSTASQRFSVQVSVPPVNGAVTYRVEASQDTMDLSVDSNTSGNRTLKVRLCEYRGGVFYDYKNFTSATVRKNSLYYGLDMVTNSTSAISLPGAKELVLTPLMIFPAGSKDDTGTCSKAEPGVYTVSLTYMDTVYSLKTENINITITDGQNPPEYSIRSLTTTNTVTNALEMVKECIHIPDSTILDCTATGTKLTGSAILVDSGEQLHIDTVKVQSVVTIATGERIYVTHEITIDKTLTNKPRTMNPGMTDKPSL